MIVNSFDFIWIFPLIFLCNTAIQMWRKGSSGKAANLFLLSVSYLLFWYYNKTMTLVLLGVSLVTWLGALAVRRYGRKASLTLTVVLLALLPLLALKYYPFINTNLGALFGAEKGAGALPGLNLAIPLGISFFTLQAIGYYIDVVKGRVEPEKNLCDYLLFVAFFPQIASGPISKASDLLPQIKKRREFDAANATQGLKWLLWGMFLKVVVADNIGLAIRGPLAQSHLYTQPTLIGSVFLYSIQIYGDFAGYSFMAVGIGLLLGFELINNFHRPYLAASVTEFWHRWHRSLSIWLKDHIYIPLGGSRCSKFRNSVNIFVTFLVSGLWHGANWNFVLWGGIHGTAQVAEKRLGLQDASGSRAAVRAFRIVLTYCIVTLAWLFFLQPTIPAAWSTLTHIFSPTGKNTADLTFALILAGVVIAKDLIDEYAPRFRPMHSPYVAVRWVSYSALMFMIMVFAVYGEKFIYAGF